MNQIAKVETTNEAALALYTPDQIDLIKNTICQGATNNEYQLFMYQCTKTGLDPLAKQIYAIKRWDSNAGREVMGIQTSIDGFRLIAERSGKYSGQLGPFWCGDDGVWMDVWTSTEPPAASKVAVLRNDFDEPCWGVARFSGYSQTKKNGDLTMMWKTKGDIMIAKCAEALALRKAFPQELSGLYTSDEMDQANNDNPNNEPQEAIAQGVEPVTIKKISTKLRQQLKELTSHVLKQETSTGLKSIMAEYKGVTDEIKKDYPDELTDEGKNLGFTSMYVKKFDELRRKDEMLKQQMEDVTPDGVETQDRVEGGGRNPFV